MAEIPSVVYSCEQIAYLPSATYPDVMVAIFTCRCPTTGATKDIYMSSPFTNAEFQAKVTETMNAICITPQECPRGDVYAPLPFQGCDLGYTRKWDMSRLGYYCYCDATEVVPPVVDIPPVVTPPPPLPPPPEEKCPRGDIYTKPMFRSCDPGYYQGDLPGAGIPGMGMACICSESYIPPHVDDVNGVVEEEGILAKIMPDIDISRLSKIFDLLPMIILAAVGIAVLGMFKR